jgi:hypothetical protein
MEKKVDFFILFAPVFCLTACTGDMISALILGEFYYPGYNLLIDPISVLGASASPVSVLINIFWFTFGLFFIFFAIGFNRGFLPKDKLVKFAAILIFLYGLCDEIGSAFVPGNHVEELASLHNIIGGVGLLALIAFPIVMRSIFKKADQRKMVRFSVIITVIGIVTFLVFTVSKLIPRDDGIIAYRGMWQRLFLLNYYVYLAVISIRMISDTRNCAE